MNSHTHDLGPFFWMRVAHVDRWSTPWNLAPIWEDEAPYRHGSTLLLHVPGFRSAFGVGHWGNGLGYAETEEEELANRRIQDWRILQWRPEGKPVRRDFYLPLWRGHPEKDTDERVA